MNYSTDKPIGNKEQDLLGRTHFSKQLGNAIYKYEGNDGLVIGLFGKWGTGKTSVINMTVNEIKDLSKSNKEKPIIIYFSPWNYSNQNDLISLFFKHLKSKLNTNDKKFRRKLGRALDNYSDLIGLFASSRIGTIPGQFVKIFIKNMGIKWSKQDDDLDKAKKELEKALLKLNKKIIIIIDDIDRLTNIQIRDIFQLVKQVADFPNIIYVLAMDREVVSNALSEVHNIDGNEYLEKIIQIPFEMPNLNTFKVNEIFLAKLNQVIKDLNKEVIWDETYWEQVKLNCINPYINTLRDINRVINIFQFKFEMLYQETSFEDLVAITTIEVLEPKLYKWICNNKNVVCGISTIESIFNPDKKIDYNKIYQEEFIRLGIDPKITIKCLSTLFPSMARDVNEYSLEDQPTQNVRSKMRIAQPERFNLYFMFNLDDVKIPRTIINNIIYEYDQKSIITMIDQINNREDFHYFYYEMHSLIGNIPENRLNLIVLALLNVKSKNIKNDVGEMLDSTSIMKYLAIDIMKKIKSEEEKYEIFKSAIDNIDKNGLEIMARIIRDIELAYGRLAENKSIKQENQIISLDHLIKIEQIYIKRINEIVDPKHYSDMNRLKVAFYLWKQFDKDNANAYVKELFKNDINKLKFVCSRAGTWHGTHGKGWIFTLDSYSDYVSSEEVFNIIKTLNRDQLNEFNEIEQIKLATFILNYDKEERDHVTKQEAMELVNKWKEQ